MKKYLLLFFVTALLAVLTACGEQEEMADDIQDNLTLEEYVYVPEFFEFDMAENINSSETRILGDKLYQFNYLYDLDARKGTDQLQILSLEGDLLAEITLGGNGDEAEYSSEHLQAYDVDAEGNVYTVELAQGEKSNGSRTMNYYLCCYNDSGLRVFSQDITAELEEGEKGAYAGQLILDEEGRIYVMCQTSVKLFERDASPAGNVPVAQGSYLYTLAKGKSGDVYIFYRGNASGDNSIRGAKVDFEAGQLREEFGNLPDGGSYGDFCPGEEGDFFINVGSKVYEYDIEAQNYEEVFTWLDCDIIGSNVSRIDRTNDGELFAVIEDWSAWIREVAFLKRISASEAKPKTEIVLGLIYYDSDAQAAAVNFNKRSDEYRVVIRTYVDSNEGESYEDGLTRLNIDITTGDSPDILDLTQLNMEALTFGGAVEDLTPYLEASNVLDREDYLENVLEGYTYGGKLAALPHSLSLVTMAGKTSELGEEMGWTLEEVLYYAREHPQAKLFYGAEKSSILEFCMSCNMKLFLDWESGEVRFDSEGFVALLEYVNGYSDIVNPQADSSEPPELLQSGEVLLYPVRLNHFENIQLYPALFDQSVTFIGYPTVDGSANAIMHCDKLYGISAASQNKEGAWTFIEYWLSRPVEWNFSPRRSQLELQIEEAKESAKDSNGEPILDEDGNPLSARVSGVQYGFDGWKFTFHACTDEEIGWVTELLSKAKPVKESDSQVMSIIEEEVQALYAGQRSAEDVAKIIQSRVQIYVDENR